MGNNIIKLSAVKVYETASTFRQYISKHMQLLHKVKNVAMHKLDNKDFYL